MLDKHYHMNIKISFTGKDESQVRTEHGELVMKRIKEKIKNKNNTLEWKNTVEECTQRFYTTIRKNEYIFPIIEFNINKRAYRAILCWIKEYNTFEFIKVISKVDNYPSSEQKEVSMQLVKHPEKIASKAKLSLEQKKNQMAETAQAD